MPENSGNPEAQSVKAHPTKAFFVSMLTRDISLEDAILDLVDNSLDGALRSSGADVDYSQFFVDIHLERQRFRIEDNCGGIERSVAINYAFKMGRDPNDPRDHEHETIGMYGIGMKRAVFKLGRSITIRTRHMDDQYQVRFIAEWMDSPQWSEIPLEPVPDDSTMEGPGTSISVEQLRPGVAEQLNSPSFLNDLRRDLGDHFTTFIQRGFSIRLNGLQVTATDIRVLLDPSGQLPFFYQGHVGSTRIRVAVGLNAGSPLGEDDEGDDAHFLSHRSIATSGWTVFCNDRAVLVGDQTRLTGWGDGAPKFHPQFAIITGIVEFRSNEANDLPITTTKRALDTSSESWLVARSIMRDGLRVFTTLTNRWKNIPKAELEPFFRNAAPMTIEQIADAIQPHLRPSRTGMSAQVFDPSRHGQLPEAPGSSQQNRRIIFSRPRVDIERLAQHLLEDREAPPSAVGSRCFDKALNEMEQADG